MYKSAKHTYWESVQTKLNEKYFATMQFNRDCLLFFIFPKYFFNSGKCVAMNECQYEVYVVSIYNNLYIIISVKNFNK